VASQDAVDVSPRALLRATHLVGERAGLAIDDRRAEALVEELQKLAAGGRCSPDDVLDACEAGDAESSQALVAALLVGETHFYRARPHFNALVDVIYPELLARRATQRSLRIWSAGCSTGEEAYTLAMTLEEAARRQGVDLADWRVEIVGTDIDERALDAARRAEYGRYSFRGVSPGEREAGFDAVGEGTWRVKPRFRQAVRFQRLNLVAPWEPAATFSDLQLVACRNVTIYFTPEATRRLADRFFEALSPGGFLLVGHAEHSFETYARFEPRVLPEAVLYERPDEIATARPAEPARAWRATLVDSPPQALAVGELDAARDALKRGDLPEAVEHAARRLEREPDNADACLLLGEVAADRGREREAAIWLRRALALRPLDLAAHYLLALLALEQGSREEALGLLDQALYVDPGCVMALQLVSRVRRDLGDAAGAERHLRHALRVLGAFPDDAPVPLSQGLRAAEVRALLSSLLQGAPAPVTGRR
jgi:chemotaxis protein methyltransferase CheR